MSENYNWLEYLCKKSVLSRYCYKLHTLSTSQVFSSLTIRVHLIFLKVDSAKLENSQNHICQTRITSLYCTWLNLLSSIIAGEHMIRIFRFPYSLRLFVCLVQYRYTDLFTSYKFCKLLRLDFSEIYCSSYLLLGIPI